MNRFFHVFCLFARICSVRHIQFAPTLLFRNLATLRHLLMALTSHPLRCLHTVACKARVSASKTPLARILRGLRSPARPFVTICDIISQLWPNTCIIYPISPSLLAGDRFYSILLHIVTMHTAWHRTVWETRYCYYHCCYNMCDHDVVQQQWQKSEVNAHVQMVEEWHEKTITLVGLRLIEGNTDCNEYLRWKFESKGTSRQYCPLIFGAYPVGCDIHAKPQADLFVWPYLWLVGVR